MIWLRGALLYVSAASAQQWDLAWQHDSFSDDRQACVTEAVWSFCETYTQINTEQAPQLPSNGHLHQLQFSLSGQHQKWQWRLTPRYAASSNLIKHSAGSDHRAWQWSWQLHYAKSNGDQQWRFGLQNDFVFGDNRVYPVVEWQAALRQWNWSLGWPRTQLTWQHDRWFVHWLWQPGGRHWLVADETREFKSTLREQQWLSQLSVGYNVDDWTISLSAQQSHQHRLRYYDQFQRYTQYIDDRSSVALSATIRF